LLIVKTLKLPLNVKLFSLFLTLTATVARADDRLVGVWMIDDGFQISELLLRSDGRYQFDTRSADPITDLSSSERGRYRVSDGELFLTPYDFIGEPESRRYSFQNVGDSLSLTRRDFELPEVLYQLQPGSRADVLAREEAEEDLVGSWTRNIPFWGAEEYTFRPGGYYFIKSTPLDNQFPPEFVRGRYTQNGNRVSLKPYSGIEVERELDFFGNALTLVRDEQLAGEAATYEEVPGSEEQVRAKSAEGDAFLAQQNWQVGIWEIRSSFQTVDLTIRPDGRYVVNETTEGLNGVVRGLYTLEPRRIHLSPFAGQAIYARSNGEFGKVERSREIDFYDGELQLIDLASLSQSVTLARKRPGSEGPIVENVRLSQLERQREGWQIGVWEVSDPSGWMEFTFRPDDRYIAKSGTGAVPTQVERGQYKLTAGKVTLAPYSGLGPARGFELDLYDGELFLVGDSQRMVVARKIPNSDRTVIEKTLNPVAMNGERGGILGRWTAEMPGASAELVFRHDGQFRLNRCVNNIVSQDYGLYTADIVNRTVLSDSRFTVVQTLGLDFYGETLTIYGGLQAPSTYKVNLGTVDSAIQASFAAEAAEAAVDLEWLGRIAIGPRNPNAVQVPVGNIPADPLPSRIFSDSTVFHNYQLYRRLIPGFVYFNVNGTIKSVAVTHTREWHFFPNGRVLTRFKNYGAGLVWPATNEDVSDGWGAYRIDPKPPQHDILHMFADNGLTIESDLGEVAEMTLEDGRRHLFWGKDYQLQYEWAAEQKNVPCQLPPNSDSGLINVAVSLSTTIPPDPIGGARPTVAITGPAGGAFTVSGTSQNGGMIVIEATSSLAPPILWRPVQTNTVSAGQFGFAIPQGSNKSGYFRAKAE
jgi:hypothetical protein